MRTGVTHSYQFFVDGKPFGTRRDMAGYNPDSYPKPGVPQGTLSEKKTIASKLYEGPLRTIGSMPRRASIRPCPRPSWSGRTARD